MSRRETDDLKHCVEKTVSKFLGFNEPTLVTAAINCIDKGYEKRKAVDKLSSILEKDQASKFADKLFNAYDDYRSQHKHARTRKRKEGEQREREEIVEPKRSKRFDDAPVPMVPQPGQPSPGQLTTDKIKEMMASAQKMIQERKAQLSGVSTVKGGPGSLQSSTPQPFLFNDAMEKAKRAAELQQQIQMRMSQAGIMPLASSGAVAAAAAQGATAAGGKQVQSKPTPLILDEQGRTIDAKTGEAVQLTHHMPTLKANIRAKRREQFKAVQDKPPEEISETKFFDARLGARSTTRTKKAFKFHEQGKFEQMASRLRAKAQLEKLQNEIAQAAKKTGIASAAKLATITPKKELKEGEIPEVEWWDSVILISDSYDGLDDKTDMKEKYDGVTHLVEHPTQMKAPAEPTNVIQIPVMLTKKERKKIRRQNRNETQKELTEKIRLGLLPPPEPKVRMANLMRVLGSEAVQDPTKIEQHVREQMAKRQKTHEEANAARKLTKEQRRDKKISKIKEDVSLGVKVTVYRLTNLSNPSKKFKVETNAKQLYMTGFVVLHKDCNVVVVEGGPKQQNKFRRLMLHRIKWAENKSKKDDDDESDDEVKKQDSCVLVWEGEVKQRAFGEMKFKMCPTESFAREQFKKAGVEHYWDLAYSTAILESTGEDL